MTPEKKYIFIFFILTQKILIRLLSIFDMYINTNERVDVNQDGPSLIIEDPSPLPPRPPK